jgi:hypothetical protein
LLPPHSFLFLVLAKALTTACRAGHLKSGYFLWYPLGPQSAFSSLLQRVVGLTTSFSFLLSLYKFFLSLSHLGRHTSYGLRQVSNQDIHLLLRVQICSTTPIPWALLLSLPVTVLLGGVFFSSLQRKEVNHLLPQTLQFPLSSLQSFVQKDWNQGMVMCGSFSSEDSLCAPREMSGCFLATVFRIQGLYECTCVVLCFEPWCQVWQSPAQHPALLEMDKLARVSLVLSGKEYGQKLLYQRGSILFLTLKV